MTNNYHWLIICQYDWGSFFSLIFLPELELILFSIDISDQSHHGMRRCLILLTAGHFATPQLEIAGGEASRTWPAGVDGPLDHQSNETWCAKKTGFPTYDVKHVKIVFFMAKGLNVFFLPSDFWRKLMNVNSCTCSWKPTLGWSPWARMVPKSWDWTKSPVGAASSSIHVGLPTTSMQQEILGNYWKISYIWDHSVKATIFTARYFESQQCQWLRSSHSLKGTKFIAKCFRRKKTIYL